MAADPPTRPALRARYDYRQQQIVDAAARLFAVQGFHASSIEDLVVETGLTAGGLYHYIGGKEDLLVLICDHLMEPLLARVREIVAVDAPGHETLREVVREWTRHVELNRDHMLVFQQERHVLERGPKWRAIRRQRKDFEELLDLVLARCERDATLVMTDRDLALRALLGMVNHTAQWFRPHGRLTTQAIADGYVDLLLRNSQPPA
jgi:AcrR family transcriptional regulator